MRAVQQWTYLRRRHVAASRASACTSVGPAAQCGGWSPGETANSGSGGPDDSEQGEAFTRSAEGGSRAAGPCCCGGAGEPARLRRHRQSQAPYLNKLARQGANMTHSYGSTGSTTSDPTSRSTTSHPYKQRKFTTLHKTVSSRPGRDTVRSLRKHRVCSFLVSGHLDVRAGRDHRRLRGRRPPSYGRPDTACPRAQALPSLEAGENQPVQRTRPRLPV
jgi:hypothetical protein